MTYVLPRSGHGVLSTDNSSTGDFYLFHLDRCGHGANDPGSAGDRGLGGRWRPYDGVVFSLTAGFHSLPEGPPSWQWRLILGRAGLK